MAVHWSRRFIKRAAKEADWSTVNHVHTGNTAALGLMIIIAAITVYPTICYNQASYSDWWKQFVYEIPHVLEALTPFVKVSDLPTSAEL